MIRRRQLSAAQMLWLAVLLATSVAQLLGCSNGPANPQVSDKLTELGAQVSHDDDGRIAYVECYGVEDLAQVLAQIKQCNHIKTVSFNGAEVADDDLQQIAHLDGELTFLALTGTAVSDEGMAHVAAISSLERLSLGGTSISDEGIAALSKLERLRNLDLFSTKITDDSVAALSGMKQIAALQISGTNLTKEGVAKLQAALPDAVIAYSTAGSSDAESTGENATPDSNDQSSSDSGGSDESSSKSPAP
ncbi:MAG: hypothetical protein QGG36_13225 [Pirellulaceae bacterium]|jgi:hypothetical protein|nr:hypothetical protein [Pirellulaceae bacterium]